MSFSVSRSPSFLSPYTWAEKWTAFRNRKELEDITNKVSKDCLIEIGVAFSYLCVSAFFISSLSFGAYLLCLAIGIVAINALIRHVTKASFFKGKEQEAHSVRRWLSFNFSFLDAVTRQTITHEMGHAFFGMLFFKGMPHISLSYGGGETACSDTLSRLGKFFGEKNALFLFNAGGPLFALWGILLMVLAAHLLQETHPQIAQYLYMFSLADAVSHIFYSLSALIPSIFSSEDLSGHDFIGLWKRGIHPIASASLFVLLPLILKTVLNYFSQEKTSTKKLQDQRIITPLQSFLFLVFSQI